MKRNNNDSINNNNKKFKTEELSDINDQVLEQIHELNQSLCMQMYR